jgi:hypothetical protein
MSRLEFKATELTNTDVNFVSLVKRGANRLPFRITKGEGEMLDLYAIGRKMFQKADAVPTVVAIVTQKADAPVIAKISAVCGLGDKLAKSDDDGVVTLSKEGDKFEAGSKSGLALVKLDNDLALAVKGSDLRKAAGDRDWTGTIYAGAAGEQGYFFSPALASQMLSDHAASLLKSADPVSFGSELAKASEDLKAYVETFGVLMPAGVIKADAVLKACGTGNATGGAATDQETGDGLGDKANGKGAAKKADGDGPDKGDPGAEDPLMPDAGKKVGTRAAKGDAGKNGTGAGAELGEGTGSTPRATSDDAENNEVDAKPGAPVSGDTSGMPAKAKAPTKKAEGQKAMDDDSTNGAQSGLPPKAKSPTTAGGTHAAKSEIDAFISLAKSMGFVVKTSGDGGSHVIEITSVEPHGESQAGEGAAQGADKRPEDRADAEAGESGGDVTGKVKGKTLSLEGVPAKAISPTTKNDGDAEIGKKGKGETLSDEQSGSGAQEKDVQTLKADAGVMQAIQALAKSVQESHAAVTKSVNDLSAKVESVTALAKKTDAALNGTVFNDEGGDKIVVAKGDQENGGIPLLDTAYSRRRA